MCVMGLRRNTKSCKAVQKNPAINVTSDHIFTAKGLCCKEPDCPGWLLPTLLQAHGKSVPEPPATVSYMMPSGPHVALRCHHDFGGKEGVQFKVLHYLCRVSPWPWELHRHTLRSILL